jgi:hypothetical protein
MKKNVLTSLTLATLTATLAVISTPLLAQDDSVLVPSEETRQERREALRELSPQDRQERRSAARDHFESLSEEEQAEVRELRQRQQARRAKNRSLRSISAAAPTDGATIEDNVEPDSSQ